MLMFSKLNNKAYLLLIISIFILFFLQWHNAVNYPVNRGLDAKWHAQYIQYLKIHKRIPLANEGWELYQPPLYYILGSFFSGLEAVRLLGFFSWITLIISAYIFFKKIFHRRETGMLGALVAASIPVIIYLSPAIGNEFFSAVIISVTLIYYLLTLNNHSLKSYVILGILLGLAMLAKSTAFILVICIIVDWIWEHKKNILSFLILLIVSGWFYIRNFAYFKNPFVTSVDFPEFAFTPIPEERGIKFFTDLSPFLKLDLFNAQHYSFLAGTYFSWFYDGHNVMIPVQNFSKAGVLLLISTLPIFFISFVGYLKELKIISKYNRILIIYPLLLFISYVLYNFKIPYYSSVKGVFLVSLVIPFTYFFLKGIEKYKKCYWLIYFYIFIYCLLIAKNFWILPKWYK